MTLRCEDHFLPWWGRTAIVANGLMALTACVLGIAAIKTHFHPQSDPYIPLIGICMMLCVATLVWHLGAYKGKGGWFLAALITSGLFIALSCLYLMNQRHTAPTMLTKVLKVDLPVRSITILAFAGLGMMQALKWKSRWSIWHIISCSISYGQPNTQTTEKRYYVGFTTTSTHPPTGIQRVTIPCSHCGTQCDIIIEGLGHCILKVLLSTALLVAFIVLLRYSHNGALNVAAGWGIALSAINLLIRLVDPFASHGLRLAKGDNHEVHYDGTV